MEENNKKVGRPPLEKTMPPQWYEIIVESGREGKHITDFLIKLGISWEGHRALLKRNTKYSEAVAEHNKLSEDWWFEQGRMSMERNGGIGFNSRLWSLVLRNKFKDNWKDEKQMDITTQGDKISDGKTIQIEIIKGSTDGEA
jgi:hypothetical protein